MAIFQLVYFSKAIPGLTERNIEEIVRRANDFNHEKEITGVLLFHSGIFLQLLEGEKTKVEGLFAKIQEDRRHSNVMRFLEMESPVRIFPDWSMGYSSLNHFDPAIVSQILMWNRIIQEGGQVSAVDITKVLGRFRAVLNSRKIAAHA